MKIIIYFTSSKYLEDIRFKCDNIKHKVFQNDHQMVWINESQECMLFSCMPDAVEDSISGKLDGSGILMINDQAIDRIEFIVNALSRLDKTEKVEWYVRFHITSENIWRNKVINALNPDINHISSMSHSLENQEDIFYHLNSFYTGRKPIQDIIELCYDRRNSRRQLQLQLSSLLHPLSLLKYKDGVILEDENYTNLISDRNRILESFA